MLHAGSGRSLWGRIRSKATYRRFNDGDYKCNASETRRMLADQFDDSLDGQVVEHFGLDDLDPESIRQYRQIFSDRSLMHPWITLPDARFLEQIGACARIE